MQQYKLSYENSAVWIQGVILFHIEQWMYGIVYDLIL
jgi:hypothetical protein